MNIYYVSKNGSDKNSGLKQSPFLTISKAAEVAKKGDTVIVHEGTYREWVKPKYSGNSDIERITYKSAEGEKVIIKGSEVVSNWEQTEGNIWKVTLDNSFFGDFNPYREEVFGDWLVFPKEYKVHLGDVYLNGKSFFEAKSMEDLKDNSQRTEGFSCPWSKIPEYIRNPENTIYKWYSVVDNNTTTIYANFQEYNPNNEMVEINVRKACFMPDEIGKNYITVKGFEMAQAACGWAPPTAEQPGLIAPYWSKGWIIEDNIIHDAKCSGISLGKEKSTGQNEATLVKNKPGYQYQLEVVCKAYDFGWNKDNIGSHIVNNNIIYDCGQNGIVGHLGCVFSHITNNEIYNIATKYEFYGHEVAAIKLHAAIDTVIANNKIHNNTLGTWLDWQAQGTRVSKNLYYKNDRDLFTEVSHGPCIIDNNIFASQYSFDNVSQGTAFIHNLICGGTRKVQTLHRSTPYHFAHTTKLKGFAYTYSGDDRHYNNIYFGNEEISDVITYGSSVYNDHPSSFDEYLELIGSEPDPYSLNKYIDVLQPVYLNNNAYFNGAPQYSKEKRNYISPIISRCAIVEKTDGIYLEIELEQDFLNFHTELVETKTLGVTRITDCIYDDYEGKEIVFNNDLTNQKREEKIIPGPIQNLKSGNNLINISSYVGAQ